MTAEERAAKAMTAAHFVCDRHPALLAKVAAAIRAAEDEALERAARQVEANAERTNIVGFMQIEDAKVIRSLKSKERPL